MLPYRSLMDRLRTQHEAIDPVIADIAGDKMTSAPAPGKWSIKDHVAHLARYQPVFIDRIHRICSGERPVFESYAAENDPEFATWQQWTLPTLLDRLHEDRRMIIQLIDHLSCTQVEAVGVHQRFGEMTTIQWTEFFLLHEAHHLFTIFKLAHTPSHTPSTI